MAYFYHSHVSAQGSRSDSAEIAPTLLTFSKLAIFPEDVNTLHMHAHLELFYFVSGIGILEWNHKRIPIHAHDFLLINAQNLHVLSVDPNTTEPLVYYNLAIDCTPSDPVAPNPLTRIPVFHHSFVQEDNPIFSSLCLMSKEVVEKSAYYDVKLSLFFQALILDTVRLIHSGDSDYAGDQHPYRRERLSQVKGYIETHFADNLSLNDLCQLAMFQKSYFIRQFKEDYGISPSRYLNLVRLERAKLLLTNSEKTVTEIATEVGFNHSSYFSEMFLKAFGTSPTQYRKQIAQNSQTEDLS